ncbi:hypothetical protein AX14_003407 [Amanita brunnescens Koide BX004]|nr:hypothetical protein AX14_003407 [Amanita brunnescens Koide BX004]
MSLHLGFWHRSHEQGHAMTPLPPHVLCQSLLPPLAHHILVELICKSRGLFDSIDLIMCPRRLCQLIRAPKVFDAIRVDMVQGNRFYVCIEIRGK